LGLVFSTGKEGEEVGGRRSECSGSFSD
jgi:hypothetical protein